MKKTPEIDPRKNGWLLFFYSVPTKPVASRIKVWRRLLKAGAIQLKGAVYMLPYSEERYELLQWLVSEVSSMKGDSAFVRVEKVETMKDGELKALFNQHRDDAYRVVEKGLEELERKVNAVKNASGVLKDNRLKELLKKQAKGFEEIRRIDFFSSGAGNEMGKRLRKIEAEIEALSGPAQKKKEAEVILKSIQDYQGKTWVTRKKPFVDRMAAAWLIRRFIDKDAVFGFTEEADVEATGNKEAVLYDMRGGEFTHVGDMCTFEVMVKSFGLKDRPLKAMAEVVHELDVKDEKYGSPEAMGVEEILSGIRKTAKSDQDALEKGMAVFEMLYEAKR